MIDDPVLLNDWYIVAAARELADEAMLLYAFGTRSS